MIPILGTTFVALMGLAFGSFLNVCLTRWPKEECIVSPRSHCRDCYHVLTWWENVPLLSWLALRGRCRVCRAWIGWRYPVVELAVAVLWSLPAWKLFSLLSEEELPLIQAYDDILIAVGWMLFYWLIVGLAFLDAEHLWLPDRLTITGAVLGCLVATLHAWLVAESPMRNMNQTVSNAVRSAFLSNVAGMAIAAGLILFISGIYWLMRRREGIGPGDARLMALLAAWLGLPGALLAFGLGVVLGALVALVLLAVRTNERSGSEGWALTRLPLGTFLCIGGLVSSFWSERMITGYLRWAGF
jgi:leader peptidase (prepilin peptidase)/N-methyltransferase